MYRSAGNVNGTTTNQKKLVDLEEISKKKKKKLSNTSIKKNVIE
jgi:hypothetical protein